MHDVGLEAAGFEVSCDAEIVEVAESSGHPLSGLDDLIDGLHRGIGEAGFHEGQYPLPVGLCGFGEFPKGL